MHLCSSCHNAAGAHHITFVAEINSELLSAETRCALLEKQLSYMQRMVEAAERGRREAVQREAELQQRRWAGPGVVGGRG